MSVNGWGIIPAIIIVLLLIMIIRWSLRFKRWKATDRAWKRLRPYIDELSEGDYSLIRKYETSLGSWVAYDVVNPTLSSALKKNDKFGTAATGWLKASRKYLRHSDPSEDLTSLLVLALIVCVIIGTTGVNFHIPPDHTKVQLAQDDFGFVSGKDYPLYIYSRNGGSSGYESGSFVLGIGFANGKITPASSFPFSFYSAKTKRDYIVDIPMQKVRFETMSSTAEESLKITLSPNEETVYETCNYVPKLRVINFVAVQFRDYVCHRTFTGDLGGQQLGEFLTDNTAYVDVKITKADYQQLLGKG